MSYNVIDIEGIGETYSAKLEQHGIKTTDDLLQKAGNKAGREMLAASTKIPESLILTWVNHADLFRISGIAGQTAELLEAAGVDTVTELSNRNAENLHQKLQEVNDQFGLSGKVPSIEKLEGMIIAAGKLDKKVFH
jgi:predicted flap endonuclease-1-like 5' DNA nuclease